MIFIFYVYVYTQMLANHNPVSPPRNSLQLPRPGLQGRMRFFLLPLQTFVPLLPPIFQSPKGAQASKKTTKARRDWAGHFLWLHGNGEFRDNN